MIICKILVLKFAIVISFTNVLCKQEEEEQKVTLDLSRAGDTYVNGLKNALTTFIKKQNFGDDAKTVRVLYEIIPPAGAKGNVGNTLGKALKSTIANILPSISLSGKKKSFIDKDTLKKVVFNLTLSNMKKSQEDSGKQYTSFVVNNGTNLIKTIKTPSEEITSLKSLVSTTEPAKAVVLDKEADDDEPEGQTSSTVVTEDELGTEIPVKVSITKTPIEVLSTETPKVALVTELSTISLESKDGNIKENIVDVVRHYMVYRNWDPKKPKLVLFTFKTIMHWVTPDELNRMAKNLDKAIRELEPNCEIYPASFHFVKNNVVLVKIKVQFPIIGQSAIYKFKTRFPDVKNHMVELEITRGLGKLPSKVEQILGYKLWTTKSVKSGDNIHLNLPFKIINVGGRTHEASLRPLIVSILKTFSNVHYVTYDTRDFNSESILLIITVDIPYSLNKAQFGLQALEEFVPKKIEKGFFETWIG